jgi:colanic acid/amylovoran biosynthesis protein
MKKILIKNFPNLNNYGTAMMGLITIQSLIKNYGKENIEIYCSFDKYAIKEEVYKELEGLIELKTYTNSEFDRISKIKKPFFRRLSVLWGMFFYNEKKMFDKTIVLGGDDFSEYYSKYIASVELYKLWRYSKHTEVVMLGQTIGPFSSAINRFTFKQLLPKINVYARDPWTVQYFQKKFNINIRLMGDIAFNPLPLQSKLVVEKNVLEEYKLIKNNYFTVVISGLFESGYYCESEDLYLLRHQEVIQEVLKLDALSDKKVVLLAHTFPPYGDESSLIQKLFHKFSEKEKERIIIVTEKILPTKARFILGNGLFSITGRMHPAVSTFQMGKPSIMLSYSAKYQGVIGIALNRSDLIIDANTPELWISGEIVSLVKEKVTSMLDNYSQMIAEISLSVDKISIINSKVLKQL